MCDREEDRSTRKSCPWSNMEGVTARNNKGTCGEVQDDIHGIPVSCEILWPGKTSGEREASIRLCKQRACGLCPVSCVGVPAKTAFWKATRLGETLKATQSMHVSASILTLLSFGTGGAIRFSPHWKFREHRECLRSAAFNSCTAFLFST